MSQIDAVFFFFFCWGGGGEGVRVGRLVWMKRKGMGNEKEWDTWDKLVD